MAGRAKLPAVSTRPRQARIAGICLAAVLAASVNVPGETFAQSLTVTSDYTGGIYLRNDGASVTINSSVTVTGNGTGTALSVPAGGPITTLPTSVVQANSANPTQTNTITNAGTLIWTGADNILISVAGLQGGEIINTGVMTTGTNKWREPSGTPGVDFVSGAASIGGDSGIIRNSGDGLTTGIINGTVGALFQRDGALTGVGGGAITGLIQGANGSGVFIGNWQGVGGYPQGRLLQTLSNAGTIIGESASGIPNGAGISVGNLNGQLIENLAGGTITGSLTGILIGQGSGTIANATGRTIEGFGSGGAGIQIVNYTPAGDAVAEQNVLLRNLGTISGVASGVSSSGTTSILRIGQGAAGSIRATDDRSSFGIQSLGPLALGGLDGSGAFVAADAFRGRVSGAFGVRTASLDNNPIVAGTIRGRSADGFQITDLGSRTVTNRGTISGGGAFSATTSSGAMVIGTSSGGTLVNEAGALIFGTRHGILIASPSTLTIDNSGFICGGTGTTAATRCGGTNALDPVAPASGGGILMAVDPTSSTTLTVINRSGATISGKDPTGQGASLGNAISVASGTNNNNTVLRVENDGLISGQGGVRNVEGVVVLTGVGGGPMTGTIETRIYDYAVSARRLGADLVNNGTIRIVDTVGIGGPAYAIGIYDPRADTKIVNNNLIDGGINFGSSAIANGGTATQRGIFVNAAGATLSEGLRGDVQMDITNEGQITGSIRGLSAGRILNDGSAALITGEIDFSPFLQSPVDYEKIISLRNLNGARILGNIFLTPYYGSGLPNPEVNAAFNVILENSATSSIEGSVFLQSPGPITVTNQGSIVSTDPTTAALRVSIDTSAGVTASVANTGLVQGEREGLAVDVDFATGGPAAQIFVTNGQSGQIFGNSSQNAATGAGIPAGIRITNVRADVINEGEIAVVRSPSGNTVAGMALTDGGSMTLTNQSTGIVGVRTSLASATYDTAGTAILLQGTGSATITNRGNIYGATLLDVGNDRIDNSGTITGSIALGGGNDSFSLFATGVQTGAVSGGAGTDALRIDTATGSSRTITETGASSFTGFETLVLNGDVASAGTIVLSAATAPGTTATLDLGGGAGTSAVLERGTLNLQFANSSIRAETVTIAAGASLTGNGVIYNGVGASGTGTTTVAGRVAPGNSVGQLTINGNLTLAAGSLLDFELGQVNVAGGPLNDLIRVTGNLALNGALLTVAQSAGGSFTGPGFYRIIDYDGSLSVSGSGLTILGALPNGLNGSIETGTPRQVNLVILAGPSGQFQYWDGPNATPNGVVDGGTDEWTATRTNWTTATGTPNGAWSPALAIFQGTPGVVSLTYRPEFEGLVFQVGGYVIQTSTGAAGAGLGTVGSGSFVTVNGSFDATISAPIDGGGSLDKQGVGRLILTGTNLYSGGTAITAGTLSVGSNGALGSGAVAIANGAVLQAFVDGVRLPNAVTIGGAGTVVGTIDTQSYRLDLTGGITGNGALRKTGTGTLGLLANVSLGSVDLAAGALENRAIVTLTGGVTMGAATTLDNRAGAEIIAPGLILGDAGAQTVLNAGTITGSIALGGGGDLLVLTDAGRVSGTSAGGATGTNTLRFNAATLDMASGDSGAFSGFQRIEKTGANSLTVSGSGLSTGLFALQAGTVDNTVTLSANDSLTMAAGTILNNRAGATVDSGANGIIGDAGAQTVLNAGTMTGAINLGGGNDSFSLFATGVQTGAVSGGAGTDALRIDVASGASRTITETGASSFTGFETLVLNGDVANTGTIVLSAAAAPATAATLDLGGGAGTSAVLERGTLNLQFANSSIRAETVTIASGASLTGNGVIYNGVGASGTGTTTVAGRVAPGNSIGLLTVFGNYVQTGAYEVEYRPVPPGSSRGRNLVEGTAVSLAEQDADLIRVSGTATLTGGTLVPVALGSAAEFAASRAASPTGELRYLVLRAEQGLGGTRYAALSNIATVRTEYPGNGTDVELVVSGTPVPPDVGDGDNRPAILLPSAPPPALAARDGTLRQWGLSQNGVLFDLATDCDRPIGLSGAARDENWCSFGQGRLATASGSGGDELSVYGGAWAQSGLGRSRLNVADAAAGVMRRVGDEAWLGMAVGYGLGWFDFGGAGGEAFKTSFNALQLAGLGRWASGPLELRGMLGYGLSEVESQRPSGLRGSDTRLVADYDVQQATAAGEARWWFGTRGELAVAPTLRLTGSRQWRGGYSEEGTSADRFTAESATWDSLRMALGVTGEIGVTVLETPLVIEPRLGWVRELGDRAVSVTGRYAGAPDQVFTGTGNPAPRDSAVVGLAGIAQLTDRTRLRVGYDGSWYEGGSSHSLTMRLSYAW